MKKILWYHSLNLFSISFNTYSISTSNCAHLLFNCSSSFFSSAFSFITAWTFLSARICTDKIIPVMERNNQDFKLPRYNCLWVKCKWRLVIVHYMRRSNRNFTIPPPPGRARILDLLKTGSFKFPALRAKMVFKCPTLSLGLSVKNNRRRLLSSLIKLVYIYGTRRHHFKMESYLRCWLCSTRYAETH